MSILGDEYEARRKKRSGEDKKTLSNEYERAARANRQLAIMLQNQGLSEDATRFAYRAHVLQKSAFKFQMLQKEAKLQKRTQALGAWLLSWFLYFLSGYGYRPWRTLALYIGINIVCGALYFLGETHGSYFACPLSYEKDVLHLFTGCYWNWGTLLPAILDALATSVTALHGRGLFSMSFEPGNWRIYLAAAEAVFGLFIEASFIATFTQRFFGK